MKTKFFLMISLVITLLLTGCGQAAPDTTPIKIAVLPIVEALPLYVAQDGGFFEKQGIRVEFIPVGAAAERDQIISAGQADGMINDLLSVALYNRKEITVQVVRFMRVAGPGETMYRILAAPGANIKTVKDLAGVEIGISQGSIIDYVTNQILTREGLAADQVKTIAVPKIPDRLALLNSGQIKAATLPEPFGTVAMGQGATVVVDDNKYPDISNSVLSFRKKVIDERGATVKKFMAALDEAVTEVSKNPAKWQKIFGQYKLVPAGLEQTYPMPKFPEPGLPTKAQFDEVTAWALQRKLVDQRADYSASVRTW